MQETVGSLLAETSHHWRARVLYDPARSHPQLWSRWLWGGLSGHPEGSHLWTACLADLDGDGQCDEPDADGDGDPDTTDCDDADASIYTGAPESCDAVDSDCDGSLVDEFDDTDGDLDPDCTDPDDDDDGDPDTTDCADADPSVYSGAPEISDDGIDQDCNGFDTVTCFADIDGDGFGSPATLLADDGDCSDLGESLLSSDCDDAAASVYPGALESCDAIDSDCDGSLVDEFVDTNGDGDPDCTDPDDDGDGDPDATDCGPFDPAIYTGAPESCDAIDSDCDGSLVDEFTDTDGDLDPDCTDPDDDGDSDPDATDCGPTDPAIYTGAPESCDAIDSDCDGSLVDEFIDTDTDGTPDCVDTDDDGDGDPDATDCDDVNPAIFTGATETPDDGIDQDCSGADTITCFVDADGDTFGGPSTLLASDGDCADSGESTASTDCDDDEPSTYPGAPESCDTVDSDCDGSFVDSFVDTDGDLAPDCIDDDDDDDGFPDAVDCGPTDADIYPNAPEFCDAIDSNCNGDLADGFDDSDGDGIPDCVDIDTDGDGYDASIDCDDEDAAIHPGAPESPDDGIDQDCNGADTVTCFEDLDGDTFGSSTPVLADDGDCTDDAGETDNDLDCDDASPSVFTGAPEIPDDGIDQDCSGADTVTCFVDSDGDGYGTSSTLLAPDGDCVDTGESTVDSDCAPADPAVFPGASELCDAIDSDCDGSLVDEFADTDADFDPDCTDPDDDGDSEPDATDCGPLDPTVYPGAPENCDPIDSDCDGSLVDEFPDSDGDGLPDCIEDDTDGDGDPDYSDCAPEDDSIYGGAPETSDDGIDQDCNGFDTVTCFEDLDEDGFGSVESLLADDGDCDDLGESNLATDCDDDDGLVHPEAEEVCNGGIDDDCDPATDEEIDDDGDGFTICDGDCDDEEPDVYPGAPEQCDGLDNDCDPETVEDEADADGDGHRVCDGDCDDDDELTYPGAPELCDGIDNDCDGEPETEDEVDFIDWYEDVDADGFGDDGSVLLDCEQPEGYVAVGGDCDAADAAIHPQAEETCDGIDNDCDPSTDLDGTDYDADGDGVLGCAGDCDDDDPDAYPGATELCGDDVDQDCDGTEAAGEGDPECWEGGCSDCSTAFAPASLPGWLAVLALGLFGVARRRLRRA